MVEHSADKRLKHLTHLNTNELTCLNLAAQKSKIRGKINKSGIRGGSNPAALRKQREKPKDYRIPRSLAAKQKEKRRARREKKKGKMDKTSTREQTKEIGTEGV